ncbi:MAG: hypothetical protein ABJK37_17690 [Paraglaciecola sp.]|uniref:hypothetical protein n=1 Tax=Paraglaciecola sp. TaxID=1920173 RepID=UPI0032983A4D
MANKKSVGNTNEPSASSADSVELTELESLRHIVFGAAQKDIEQRIFALEQQTKDSFKLMQQSMEQNTQTLQNAMRDGFNQLEDKLAIADQGQEAKASELHSYADKISSELEMAEANSKQENDELHNRLDKEISALTVKFTNQLNQALEKLTQMSSELNSTKTDRKTLAKLLATVASNLETDEGE